MVLFCCLLLCNLCACFSFVAVVGGVDLFVCLVFVLLCSFRLVFLYCLFGLVCIGSYSVLGLLLWLVLLLLLLVCCVLFDVVVLLGAIALSFFLDDICFVLLCLFWLLFGCMCCFVVCCLLLCLWFGLCSVVWTVFL